MIKWFGLIKRKSGLTREECLQHWKEIHGPLFVSKNVPGLRRYIQHHHAKVTSPEFDRDIDGIAEIWFDDIESAQAFLQWHRFSDEAKDLRQDLRLWINVKESPDFFSEEHVLKEC